MNKWFFLFFFLSLVLWLIIKGSARSQPGCKALKKIFFLVMLTQHANSIPQAAFPLPAAGLEASTNYDIIVKQQLASELCCIDSLARVVSL